MEGEKRAKSVGQEENRYQKLITLIGDFGEEKVPVHIDKLKNELVSADQQFTEFLTELLSKCITSIPGKQYIYAACLSKANEQNPTFVKAVLDRTMNVYKDILRDGNLLRLKLTLRFLGEASALNLVSPAYFNSTLNGLLSLWKEYSQTTWDFFAYLLASAFLHTGQQVDQEIFSNFKELLKNPKNNSWKKYCKIYPRQTEEDRLDMLVKVIDSYSSQGWPQVKSLSVAEPISTAVELEPASTQWSEKWKYQSPPCFDILNTDLEQVEYTIFYEKIVEIIEAFKAKTTLAAEKLLSVGQPRVVGNAIMDGLLRLPNQPCKTIVYSTILLHLQTSSAAENIFEPLIEEIVENIVVIIDDMDLTASERVQEFLAHYISNQNFIWNWQSFLNRQLSEPQLIFLRGLLYKLVRLSYVDMVKSELPEALHSYLAPEAEATLRFADIEESVDNTDCQLIIDRINSKATNQAMKALLASKEICSSGDFLMQIFCECLFYQGAKSMLHITTYLERYFDTISSISGAIILESLSNVWKASPQRISLLTQKLLQLKLITGRDLAIFCVEKITKGDHWKDYNSLEWHLLNVAAEDSQSNKSEITEIVCRGTVNLQNTGRNVEKRLIEFLRKNIRDLDEQQITVIESITNSEIWSLKIIV